MIMRHIALGLTVSLILAACGTKGPLYQLPRQQAPSPVFVQAGEKLGLIASVADQAACRPVCLAACNPPQSLASSPATPATPAATAAATEAAGRAATCMVRCMETCPPGAASGKPLATAPRNDSKGVAWPALIPAPDGAVPALPSTRQTPQ